MRKMYFKVTCKNLKNDKEFVFFYRTFEDAQQGVIDKRKLHPEFYQFKITPVKLKW